MSSTPTHSGTSPRAIIIDAAAYREDLWQDQHLRPEVWIEKEALLGVIEGVCTEYRVPYFATRGNNSQTLQYQAGKRFADYLDQGLIPLVLHLADHDPNGIDMTRDNRERLALYPGNEVEVRRIALNMDQVRRYNPPPSFAKENDKRYGGYVASSAPTNVGSWTRFSPTVIADLIRAEIEALIDPMPWAGHMLARSEGARCSTPAKNWAKVEKLLTRRTT